MRYILAQTLGGDALAPGGNLVEGELELGKHGLAIQRALELLEEVVEDVSALAWVGPGLEQMLREQRLVDRRGHLGNENHVIGIHLGGWALTTHVRMNRVTHLMYEREDVVKLALEVHEDDRMHAIAACRIGTASLTRRLVDVNPALRQALAHDGQIVLPKWGERLENEIACLLVREVYVHVLDDGDVQIVEMCNSSTPSTFLRKSTYLCMGAKCSCTQEMRLV